MFSYLAVVYTVHCWQGIFPSPVNTLASTLLLRKSLVFLTEITIYTGCPLIALLEMICCVFSFFILAALCRDVMTDWVL